MHYIKCKDLERDLSEARIHRDELNHIIHIHKTRGYDREEFIDFLLDRLRKSNSYIEEVTDVVIEEMNKQRKIK